MLRKLIRSRFGKRDADSPRQLSDPGDLAAGDLLTFKHRLLLPPEIQGQTFEVSAVGAYHFEHGLYAELTLDGTAGERIYLGFEAGDASELCVSRTLPRADVLRLFDDDAFAALWDEDFAELQVADALPAYEGWITSRYAQTKKWAEGYYYNRDCRIDPPSELQDDDAEELRCHECEDDTGRYGLSVEISADGETEVFAEVNCPPDVIESMWPGGAPNSP